MRVFIFHILFFNSFVICSQSRDSIFTEAQGYLMNSKNMFFHMDEQIRDIKTQDSFINLPNKLYMNDSLIKRFMGLSLSGNVAFSSFKPYSNSLSRVEVDEIKYDELFSFYRIESLVLRNPKVWTPKTDVFPQIKILNIYISKKRARLGTVPKSLRIFSVLDGRYSRVTLDDSFCESSLVWCSLNYTKVKFNLNPSLENYTLKYLDIPEYDIGKEYSTGVFKQFKGLKELIVTCNKMPSLNELANLKHIVKIYLPKECGLNASERDKLNAMLPSKISYY